MLWQSPRVNRELCLNLLELLTCAILTVDRVPEPEDEEPLRGPAEREERSTQHRGAREEVPVHGSVFSLKCWIRIK
jgi:hypothetical protein